MTVNCKQNPTNVKEIKDRWWLKYVIATGVLTVLGVIVAWMRGAFVATSPKTLLDALSDAFFVPGIFAICLGAIKIVKYSDLVEFISNCFRSLVQLFKQDAVDRKYRNFHGYAKIMKEKKKTNWYILLTGLLFVAISGVLLLAFLLV